MKQYLMAASAVILLSSPCLAQQATATGTGVGVSRSTSRSNAVAVSGQGGQGGSVIINPSPATQTVSTHVDGRTEQVISGTTTVKNAPAIVAPGLAAAGLETCLGAASGGLSFVGTGITFGTSTPDPGCNARLSARTLWSMGLRKAAVARLCLDADIYRSMPEVCVLYLPVAASVGVAPTAPLFTSEGYYMQSSAGATEVIMRKTGEHKMCSNFDTATQRCKGKLTAMR